MPIESVSDIPSTAQTQATNVYGFSLVIHTLDDGTFYISTWGPEVITGPHDANVGEHQAIHWHLEIIDERTER